MNETGSLYCVSAPGIIVTFMNHTQNESSSDLEFNELLTSTGNGPGATYRGNGTGAQASQSRVMQYAVVTLYLATFVFGTLGNTLTIYGLVRTKHLKNVANCFILNLAIADDLFLLSLPFTAHSTYVHRWIFGEALCKVMNVFRGVNLYASIFTMTLMSIDRYLAVVHPFDSLKYRTLPNALAVCTLNWVVCLAIMTPYWLYATTGTTGGVVKCQICWPTETLNEHLWMWANFELVVGFILPIGIMAVCYALLLRCLVTESRSPQVRRQGKNHVWRVTTMIFLVTVVFLVCWAPHHALRLISAHKNRMVIVQGGQGSRPGSSAFGFVVANIVAQGLTFVSSCCNPFIYYITSTNFRQIYKTALCGCGATDTSFHRNSTSKSSGYYLSKKNSYPISDSFRGSTRNSARSNASGSARASVRDANARQSLRTSPLAQSQGSVKRPGFEVTDLQQRTSML